MTRTMKSIMSVKSTFSTTVMMMLVSRMAESSLSS